MIQFDSYFFDGLKKHQPFRVGSENFWISRGSKIHVKSPFFLRRNLSKVEKVIISRWQANEMLTGFSSKTIYLDICIYIYTVFCMHTDKFEERQEDALNGAIMGGTHFIGK